MPTFGKFTLILCLAFALAACGASTPEPTATSTVTPTLPPSPPPSPSPTPTPGPTVTSTATPTPEPTDTSVPSPTLTETPEQVGLPLPTGEPISSWNGIPVMPQAISGAEENGAYSYTVEVPVEQVQEFYDKEMPKVGWQGFATGTGDGSTLLLMYMKGGKLATISVIAQGNLTLVMIIMP